MHDLESINFEIEHILFELKCCVNDLNHLIQHMSENDVKQSKHLASKLLSLTEISTPYQSIETNH